MSYEATKTAQTTFVEPDSPGGFRHIKALDGIRGLAILFVLYDHLFWANSQSGNRFFDFLSELRESSWVGVNLFFALSGFLITGILFDTLGLKNYFKVFYTRRALRIFPLYYGFLFLLLALTGPLHFQWNGWQYYYLTYTSNLALWGYAPLVLPHVNINHFWSLNVEEQFYLVWPFVVYSVKSARKLIRIALSTCLVILLIRVVLTLYRHHFANPYLTFSPTFSCADNILFGCILALLVRTDLRQRTLYLAPRILTVCTAILLPLFFISHGLTFSHPLVATIGMTAVGVAATSLIAMALAPSSLAARVFSNPVLRFFGRYSYGIYVYHFSIDRNVVTWVRPWFAQHFHSKVIGVVGGASVSAVLSIIIAIASYHLFEVHFLKLKKYFSYTSTSPAAQPVTQ